MPGFNTSIFSNVPQQANLVFICRSLFTGRFSSVFKCLPGIIMLLCSLPANAIYINELDSDTAGIDDKEFIELFDGGVGNTSLDGLILVLFNGSNDQSYLTLDLSGHSTGATGFFVVGDLAVQPDIVFSFLQNGADAVALYMDDAANFLNGSAPTTINLIDAVVYGNNDPVDAGLLMALGLNQQINEAGLGDQESDSIGRIPDGSSIFATLDTPTPGSANDTPPGVIPVPAAVWLFMTALIAIRIFGQLTSKFKKTMIHAR